MSAKPTNSSDKIDIYVLQENASNTKYDEEHQKLLIEMAIRIRELADNKGVHFDKIAPAIGVSTGVLSKISNAKGFVEMTIMIRLAKYFDVSLDYILGISEVKNVSNEDISKLLGLSDISIDRISKISNKKVLNSIFENDDEYLYSLMQCTQDYINACSELKKFEEDNIEDDRLEYNDKYFQLKKKVLSEKMGMYEIYSMLVDNNIK